jgi:hypothetical protein
MEIQAISEVRFLGELIASPESGKNLEIPRSQ